MENRAKCEKCPIFRVMHQSLPSLRLVYNGGFSNFELPLVRRNSTYMARILCDLSYKVWSTFIPKFGSLELFILILDILYSSRLVAMLWQHQRLVHKWGISPPCPWHRSTLLHTFLTKLAFFILKNCQETSKSCMFRPISNCLFLFLI